MPPHFVVMGVPRSGTTALADSLNLHPEIMCGFEHFKYLATAGATDLPAAFEDPASARPLGHKTRALFLEKKSTARIFGDQNPWYFHDLPDINLAVPACKKICVYRRKLGFWRSWNARAADSDDLHWGRGQTGFFGLLELICLLHRLADVGDSGEVLMVDYEALFFDEPGVMQRICAYLGAGPDERAAAAFKNRYFAPAGRPRDHVVDEARTAYDQLGLAEAEARIFARPFLTNLEAADPLRDCCDSIRSLAPAVIRTQMAKMRADELAYFKGARAMRGTLRRFGIETALPIGSGSAGPVPAPAKAAIHPAGKNVVFLTSYPLAVPRHGGQIRSVQLIAALRRAGLKVTPIACVDPHAYPADGLGPGDVAFPSNSPLRVFDGIPIPYAADYMGGLHAAEDEESYQRILAATPGHLDLLFLEQPWMLPVAQKLRRDRGGLLVYDSQNDETALKAPILRKFHPKVADPLLAAIGRLERAACREADLVFAVNAADQAALARHAGAPAQLAPNGVEPWEATAADLDKWRRQAGATSFALYVASAHPPNYLGFFEVLTDSFGFLAPDQAILVAGGAAAEIDRMLKGRHYEGLSRSRLRLAGVLNPTDLAAVKQLAHAFVLPITAGSGSNLKTAEALFSGKWVVGTSTAFRGFERYTSMPHVVVAEPGRDFCVAIRKAMASPPPMLTAQDRARLLELTWQETLAPMTATIRAALANASSTP